MHPICPPPRLAVFRLRASSVLLRLIPPLRLVFALLCLTPASAAEVPPPSLATLRTAHPRLVFTPEIEADLRSRLEIDPLLARFVTYLRTRSDKLAEAPPVAFKSVPYAEFGLQMLPVSREVLARVTVHAFLFRLTRERIYAERTWREVENALAFPTWNPAHYLDAAEMLVAMSFAYDWAFDAWTPAQRATLRTAMIERALRRGLEIHETRAGLSSFFPTTTSNWNSVCNAGLLAAALAFAEDEPDLASRVLAHAVPSLALPQSGFEPDGASEEGPTYWSYGTEFFCLSALMLDSALGNDAGLFSSKGIAKTCLYRLQTQAPSGRNFNYADAWTRTEMPFAYAFLASRFGPAPARQNVRDTIEAALAKPGGDSDYRLAPLIALWLPPAEPDITSAAEAPLDSFFGGRTEVSIVRSAWGDRRAAYLGFKAGHASHGHNHLDLGSFFFEQAGVRWATELGPDRYGLLGYFRTETNTANPITDTNHHEPHRWSYFRVNNQGHNTLTLGDALQSREAVAPFVASGSTPTLAFAAADLSNVYPGHAHSWKRGAALVNRSWVVVRDELAGLKPGSPVEWVLLTEASVTVAEDGRSAALESKGEQLSLRLAAAPLSARLTASPALPPTAAEDQNKGVTRIALQWRADAPDAVIEVHLVPSTTAAPASSRGPLSLWPARPTEPVSSSVTL